MNADILEVLMSHMSGAVQAKFKGVEKQIARVPLGLIDHTVHWAQVKTNVTKSRYIVFEPSLPDRLFAPATNAHQHFGFDLRNLEPYDMGLADALMPAVPFLLGLSSLSIQGSEDVVMTVMDALFAEGKGLLKIRVLDISITGYLPRNNPWDREPVLNFNQYIETMKHLHTLVLRGKRGVDPHALSQVLHKSGAPLKSLTAYIVKPRARGLSVGMSFPHLKKLDFLSQDLPMMINMFQGICVQPFPVLEDLIVSHEYDMSTRNNKFHLHLNDVVRHLVGFIPTTKSLVVRHLDNTIFRQGIHVTLRTLSALARLEDLRRLEIGTFTKEASRAWWTRRLYVRELRCNHVDERLLPMITPILNTLHCDGVEGGEAIKMCDNILMHYTVPQRVKTLSCLESESCNTYGDINYSSVIHFGVHVGAGSKISPQDVWDRENLLSFTLTIHGSTTETRSNTLHIAPKYLIRLQGAFNLNKVELVGCDLDMQVVNLMRRLKQLTHISLERCTVSKEMLISIIRFCSKLQELMIEACDGISMSECKQIQATNDGSPQFRFVCFKHW